MHDDCKRFWQDAEGEWLMCICDGGLCHGNMDYFEPDAEQFPGQMTIGEALL